MIVTLDEAKKWLRIDHDEDDITIEMLIGVSEDYLKESTGITYDSTKASARLFCLILITDWYENRVFENNSKLMISDRVRFSVRSILMQLTYGSGSA